MNDLLPIDRVQSIQDFELLKLLADPHRLAILRQLMAGAATLSQLGKILDTYPARIRHHVKLLEDVGLIALTTTHVSRGFVEKYYQATARAFVINLAVLPEWPQSGALVAWGSHDLALELMAQQMQEKKNTPGLFTLPVGSLDGLIALRQGLCQIAGSHLLDPEKGEYNAAHVRHLFPGEEMLLLTLSYRQQGLLVAPGNPCGIRGLADLVREDVRFVNRRRGTGTRLWLDLHLKRLGLDTNFIRGYDVEAKTHLQVAQRVAQKQADVGLAILAAARPFQLDFIPLFEERYDLVVPARAAGNVLLQPLLDYLQSAELRQQVANLAGYDATHTGEVLKVSG
ncbi:MAG: helix-turn-helix domain-containing protein [Anaerolineales bacterium]|nr:helix-turn-helix domain-containing protein [Anaerolineales bacterium]MCB8966104.1 helix-turn-helix domain-containing protein [Ardenticatenaceae bacterium]